MFRFNPGKFSATRFYSGVNDHRSFNDDHPVLAVLTFGVIFGTGVGCFEVLRVSFEWLISPASVSRGALMSYDFVDVADLEE